MFLLHRAPSGVKASYIFQVGRFGSLLAPTPSSVTHQLREALTALICRDNDSSRVQLDPDVGRSSCHLAQSIYKSHGFIMGMPVLQEEELTRRKLRQTL